MLVGSACLAALSPIPVTNCFQNTVPLMGNATEPEDCLITCLRLVINSAGSHAPLANVRASWLKWRLFVRVLNADILFGFLLGKAEGINTRRLLTPGCVRLHDSRTKSLTQDLSPDWGWPVCVCVCVCVWVCVWVCKGQESYSHVLQSLQQKKNLIWESFFPQNLGLQTGKKNWQKAFLWNSC